MLGDNQSDATALWRNRHAHVMLAIGNCLLTVQVSASSTHYSVRVTFEMTGKKRPSFVYSFLYVIACTSLSIAFL